jgi:hypothetical protein
VDQHHDGADNALNGQLQQRPNQSRTDVYGPKTLNNYSESRGVRPHRAGNVRQPRVRAVEGPAFWQIDAAFSRLITSGHGTSSSVRGVQPDESLQLGQSDHHATSGVATLTSSQFGRITTNAARSGLCSSA